MFVVLSLWFEQPKPGNDGSFPVDNVKAISGEKLLRNIMLDNKIELYAPYVSFDFCTIWSVLWILIYYWTDSCVALTLQRFSHRKEYTGSLMSLSSTSSNVRVMWTVKESMICNDHRVFLWRYWIMMTGSWNLLDEFVLILEYHIWEDALVCLIIMSQLNHVINPGIYNSVFNKQFR